MSISLIETLIRIGIGISILIGIDIDTGIDTGINQLAPPGSNNFTSSQEPVRNASPVFTSEARLRGNDGN